MLLDLVGWDSILHLRSEEKGSLMAGPNLTIHSPINQVQEKAGTTPWTDALPEAAGQNFAVGTPVMLSAVGSPRYVQNWDGATVTAGILGVSESFGVNLPTAGAGAPVPPYGQITGSIAQQTYGIVPNQPGAFNIAIGAPSQDGRTLFIAAREATVFEALFDNSAGAVAADYTPTLADVGVSYGLTKDSGGPFWYVDKSKTAAAACVQIVSLGRLGSVVNAPVKFVFLPASIQKY